MNGAFAEEAAPAKVNLALHVVGRRADGYHLLDTLVAFPPVGDRLSARRDDRLSLVVTGPGAAALEGTPVDDNLVMRAARALSAVSGGAGAAILLDKRLPVAAGLGGGSADAAAALRLLRRIWSLDASDWQVAAIAEGLGADVPMCLAARPLRARGAGEVLTPLPDLPALGILIANAGIAVPTADVFHRLDRRDNAPLEGDPPASDAAAFLAWLARQRNDLEGPARTFAPAVGETLAALEELPGRRLVRMSGSGASCFALFDDTAAAEAAARRLRSARPGWWIAAAPLSSPG